MRDMEIDIKDIHDEVFEELKDTLPELTILELLQLVSDVASRKKSIVYSKAAKQFKPFAKEYLHQMSVRVLAKVLASQNDEEMNLAQSELLVNCCKHVVLSVRRFAKKEISQQQFLSELFDDETVAVIVRIYKKCGLDMGLIEENPNLLVALANPMIMINALPAVYEELQKAHHDLVFAREYRARVEKECDEIIREIAEQRAQMEEIVTSYLHSHLSAFRSGFLAMEQAIIEQDTDGYIKGNVMIQQALGYDVQFTSQEEFDALMDSDMTFLL